MKEFIFHLSVVIFYVLFNWRAGVIAQDIMDDVKPVKDNVITVLIQMWTLWNVSIQQFYFLLSLIDDVTRLTSKSEKTLTPSPLREWCTSFLQRYCVPVSVSISMNFWVIFSVNPRYIDAYDIMSTHMTKWDNHVFHTLNTILVFAELFITYRPYPSDIIPELKGVIKFFSCYFAAVAAAQPFSDIWLYPFFGLMTWPQWAGFIITVILFACIAYIAGLVFTNIVWRKDDIEHYSSVALKMGVKAA